LCSNRFSSVTFTVWGRDPPNTKYGFEHEVNLIMTFTQLTADSETGGALVRESLQQTME
jgi:hypothetical protein